MMKHEEWVEKYKELMDNRQLAVCANAKKLPNGEFGLCYLLLKDNFINVYDTDMKGNLFELLYSINLKQVSNLKSSSFIFNPYLKFDYENFTYKFVDFGNAKMFLSELNKSM